MHLADAEGAGGDRAGDDGVGVELSVGVSSQRWRKVYTMVAVLAVT